MYISPPIPTAGTEEASLDAIMASVRAEMAAPLIPLGLADPASSPVDTAAASR